MTSAEKHDFAERYHAAAAKAREKYRKDNPLSLGRYLPVTEIEAHPNTIDKLKECYKFDAKLIENSDFQEGQIAFLFSEEILARKAP